MRRLDYMDPARAQVDALIMTLSTVAKSNPDLDVRPFVAPVLDDAIDHIRAALGDDAVPQSAVDLMKFTTVPLRAADALRLVKQINDSLGDPGDARP